jgi:hypothetical protein
MIIIREKNQISLTVMLSLLYCIGLIISDINYLDDYGRYLLDTQVYQPMGVLLLT